MKISIDPLKLTNLPLQQDMVLAAKSGDKTNIMAVGWKTLGIMWGYPVWIVAVKPSRFTYKMLNENPEFTFHIFDEDHSHVIEIAGSRSGKNTDKIKEANLTIKPSKHVSVPIFEEALVSYECKIIHTAESGKITDHRLYFGKILATYVEESILKKD